MPLVNISLRTGKTAAYKQAIFDNVYLALRETFNVPENDQFMLLTEHDAASFCYNASYMNVARSDELVFIQLTVSNTRDLEQKKALFHRIAQRLGDNPGIRPDDVFINLVEVPKENWSFGHGLAQYA
ncbi:tautomerase family protein [Bordetella tumulicola]|uniref:tautomerase family protein n=1 Tax=Bordetella tumulicola TaxID=1649133 RepID=UPI0039EE006E